MLTAHQTGEAGPRLIVVLISHRESMGGPAPPPPPSPRLACGVQVWVDVWGGGGILQSADQARCSNEMSWPTRIEKARG